MSPGDYVPPFSDEEIDKRFFYLVERCERFLEEIRKRHPKWDLSYDLLVLKNVAVSAMDDIWRYKVYHLADHSKKSDAVKRATYLVKWITKLRPIYFRRPTDLDGFTKSFDKKDYSLFINEAFAILLACMTLASDCDLPTIALSPDFLAEIYYDLHYRNMNDAALLNLFQTLKHVASGKSLIVP